MAARLGNLRRGGSACILRYGEQERMLQGGIARTRNNRMELMSAIEGLRALTSPCEVVVVTDSDYLRRGMTEFLRRWPSNWWNAACGNPVLN
jgi:ribonuclease HI